MSGPTSVHLGELTPVTPPPVTCDTDSDVTGVTVSGLPWAVNGTLCGPDGEGYRRGVPVFSIEHAKPPLASLAKSQ